SRAVTWRIGHVQEPPAAAQHPHPQLQPHLRTTHRHLKQLNNGISKHAHVSWTVKVNGRFHLNHAHAFGMEGNYIRHAMRSRTAHTDIAVLHHLLHQLVFVPDAVLHCFSSACQKLSQPAGQYPKRGETALPARSSAYATTALLL